MKLAELMAKVADDERYIAQEDELFDGKKWVKGVFFMDTELDSTVHVTFGALNGVDWDTLCTQVKCGKDVDHITRVTGYFSFTKGYNKGKKAELEDRHRVTI